MVTELAVVVDPEDLAAMILSADRQAALLRDVRDADIRRRLLAGESQAEIARRYGVWRSHPNRLAKALNIQEVG